jgi:hypothetical protein
LSDATIAAARLRHLTRLTGREQEGRSPRQIHLTQRIDYSHVKIQFLPVFRTEMDNYRLPDQTLVHGCGAC